MSKSFLDTSVLRPLLTSSKRVKKYYQETLHDGRYYSAYIRMEFLRGYISGCIDFYFLLSMPHYETFSEALLVWSNNFQIRSHKNMEIMLANIISYRKLSDDKEGSKRAIADYIRRLVGKLHLLCKDVGQDSTYCPKGILRIDFDPEKIEESLRKFQLEIKDNSAYLNCRVNYFVKNNKKDIFDKIANSHDQMKENDRRRKGFEKIACKIKEIKTDKDITCAYCSKIGDAIIAALSLSLSDCTLEHTDYAFDYLCPIVGQEHRLHPNEVKILEKVA